MTHPSKKAAELAEAIRSDPIAAAQVKEHLKPEELSKLFGLPTEEEVENLRGEAAILQERVEELEDEVRDLEAL